MVEWESAGVTEVLGEYPLSCHYVHHKLKPSNRFGKQATNRLIYGTAFFMLFKITVYNKQTCIQCNLVANILYVCMYVQGKVKNYPHFCFSNLFTQK
jgi:hypothetical protein